MELCLSHVLEAALKILHDVQTFLDLVKHKCVSDMDFHYFS